VRCLIPWSRTAKLILLEVPISISTGICSRSQSPSFDCLTTVDGSFSSGTFTVATIHCSASTIFQGDCKLTHPRRLLQKLDYDSSKDMIIHVGDLIAKGKMHNEVLSFMREHRIIGVRGNHDQPVSDAQVPCALLIASGHSVARLDGMGRRKGLGSLARVCHCWST
jgi:hypothetical protein